MEFLISGLLLLSPSAIAWFGREAIQKGDRQRFFLVCLATWLTFSIAIAILDAAANRDRPLVLVSGFVVLVSQAVGLIAPAAILRKTLPRSRSQLSAVLGALPLGLLAFIVAGIVSVVLSCALIGCG
jgi:hypothetical protein